MLNAAKIYEMNGRIINLSFPLNEKAYDPSRKQFNALILLNQVCRLKFEKDLPLCMGVTAADIYVPGMNFIFGIADNARGCAILSVARLIYAHYEASSEILRERVLKEAAHELGHLLGLNHCNNQNCLMSFSNSVLEVDRKKPLICNNCKSLLGIT